MVIMLFFLQESLRYSSFVMHEMDSNSQDFQPVRIYFLTKLRFEIVAQQGYV